MIPFVKVFSLLTVVSISLLAIEQTRESNLYAYAHYFTSDQSAEFLSLIHQIDVEMALMNETFPTEIGSSYYHAKSAADLMNKTYHHLTNATSPPDFRIIYEEEKLTNDDNTTVQALVVANIVDEILKIW